MGVSINLVLRVRQLEAIRDFQRTHAPIETATSAQELIASSELQMIQESMAAAAASEAAGLDTAVRASMRAIQRMPRAEAPQPGEEPDEEPGESHCRGAQADLGC